MYLRIDPDDILNFQGVHYLDFHAAEPDLVLALDVRSGHVHVIVSTEDQRIDDDGLEVVSRVRIYGPDFYEFDSVVVPIDWVEDLVATAVEADELSLLADLTVDQLVDVPATTELLLARENREAELVEAIEQWQSEGAAALAQIDERLSGLHSVMAELQRQVTELTSERVALVRHYEGPSRPARIGGGW